MSTDSILSVDLKREYKLISDIKCDLAMFHVSHGIAIKNFKSSLKKVYQVKCVDRE